MSYEETKIGKLIATNPDEAAAQLMLLFEKANGNAVHAALLGGVHHATLKRWVNKLAETHTVKEEIESLRAKTTPVKMSEARRFKLEEEARERRRLLSLQRVLDNMGPKQKEQLAARVGVTVNLLGKWRRTPTGLTYGEKKLVEEALVKLRDKHRAAKRARRRGE